MHCMVDAMDADSIGATCIGTNVVLVKLIERPVARAKSCRMFFNCWAPSFDALAMIRVSSTNWLSLGGSVIVDRVAELVKRERLDG